jgi:hypothetical protein
MTEVLNKTIVLVLNRNWQAINVRTPQEAFCNEILGERASKLALPNPER